MTPHNPTTSKLPPLAKAPDFPHRGWQYCGCDDRLIANNLCHYCGQTHVRYVHTLSHPDHSGTIETGCVCAEKLGIIDAARNGERNARKRSARLKAFIQSGWKTTKEGGLYKTYLGSSISISKSGEFFVNRINGLAGLWGFRNQTEAIRDAFNSIENHR